jgi:signal transduction histidine kinase
MTGGRLDDLRTLVTRIQAAREDELAELSREIHDVVGQALTGLRMDVAWLGGRPLAGEAAVSERLAAMSDLIELTLQQVRRISAGLRPRMLDDAGLCAAVEWQARDFEARSGIRVELDVADEEPPLTAECSLQLLRIVQEALTNVARHAAATRVWVSIVGAGGEVVVEVADDGRGFDASAQRGTKTIGLLVMKERAAQCGGSVSVGPRPGGGTCVVASVPADGRAP